MATDGDTITYDEVGSATEDISDITHITATVEGAGGGNGYHSAGGDGGYIEGEGDVSDRDELDIHVGQRGDYGVWTGTGEGHRGGEGYYNGGNGAFNRGIYGDLLNSAGSGGGSSAIVTGSDVLLHAGGGGGGVYIATSDFYGGGGGGEGGLGGNTVGDINDPQDGGGTTPGIGGDGGDANGENDYTAGGDGGQESHSSISVIQSTTGGGGSGGVAEGDEPVDDGQVVIEFEYRLDVSSSTTPDQVALSWPESSEYDHRVYRAETSGTDEGDYTEIADVSDSSYTDSGLTNGKRYYYRVSKHTGGDNVGLSDEISVVTDLPAPSNVDAELV